MGPSLVGRKLGSYQITELVGQGGMATVYKGYRADIDRTVAVKVLPPHPGLDQQFIERFKLEARTIARLQHPHILPLYDYGVEDDILYLVMAYIDGGSLSQRIDKGRVPLNEIERLLRQIAPALDYAHRQGVIHRDIKPDNILLDREGNVLLADFGIVKLTEGEARLTATGGLVGTPAYMAPEQGTGETHITGSADLYSLGVVVYEMLTGRQPFTADTPMQVVIKHITEPVPNPRNVIEELPWPVEVVMGRVLAKNPQNRYQTAGEFVEDLSRAIQGTGAFANLPVKVEPAPDRTIALNNMPAAPASLTPPPPTGQTQPTLQPTVIVQPGTNPLLLLGGFAIIAALLVVVVLMITRQPGGPPPVDVDLTAAATNAALAPTVEPTAATIRPTVVPNFGRVSFSTTNSLGDTITIQVENLRPPGTDQKYVVWLKNIRASSAVKIGDLTLDALGNGVLPPYIDPEARLLPAFYNAVSITAEPVANMSDAPQGEAVYIASVPPELMDALSAIFITAEDGIANASLGNTAAEAGTLGGLLDSALAEATQAQAHAGLAGRASSPGGMHLHSEHTINILLGTEDDLNGDQRGENPGFKKGVVRYLDQMESLLNAAASAEGSTLRFQGDLELVRVCLTNARQWVDRVIVLEREMLASDDLAAVSAQIAESTQLSDAILNGVDANSNGTVDPVEGECGLTQVETYGLVIASMTLAEAGTQP
ncbi:MAG: serine/threonine protein kinase [Anaerolineae bacterium]|nr:serine/threonine protein kinase [Anaerolineae bacterium]